MTSSETSTPTTTDGRHILKAQLIQHRSSRVRLSDSPPPPKHELVRRPANVARMIAHAHHLQNTPPSFQKWREEVLLKQAPPVVFADLGYGVLDSAMVETAAYCLEKAS